MMNRANIYASCSLRNVSAKVCDSVHSPAVWGSVHKPLSVDGSSDGFETRADDTTSVSLACILLQACPLHRRSRRIRDHFRLHFRLDFRQRQMLLYMKRCPPSKAAIFRYGLSVYPFSSEDLLPTMFASVPLTSVLVNL
jgi:hypothetical protein